MRVFIPSYKRPHMPTAHWLASDPAVAGYVDVTVVVNSTALAAAYRRAGLPAGVQLHVSNLDGLVANREYIDRQLAEPGEWYLSMDDNLTGMAAVAEPWYSANLPLDWDAATVAARLQAVTPARWLEIVRDTRAEAERLNAGQAGFSFDAGYGLRTGTAVAKWHPVRHLMSKAVLRRGHALPWDHNLNTMEEYGVTAQSLLNYPTQLMNCWATFRGYCKHYEAGGIGTYEERLPHKRRECTYLMRKYPGLFHYGNARKGVDPKGELRLALHTPAQVAAWQHTMRHQTALAL